MRYELRSVGVYDRELGRVIRRSDGAEWHDYQAWLAAGNRTAPPPWTPPVQPTPDEIAAGAEIAAVQAICVELKSDAAIQALRTRAPAQVDAWIQTQVTDLASAKVVLRILARVVALLARERI